MALNSLEQVQGQGCLICASLVPVVPVFAIPQNHPSEPRAVLLREQLAQVAPRNTVGMGWRNRPAGRGLFFAAEVKFIGKTKTRLPATSLRNQEAVEEIK